MHLLQEDGILATSSCSYHIEKAIFLDMLRDAARDAHRQVRLIEYRSQGRTIPSFSPCPRQNTSNARSSVCLLSLPLVSRRVCITDTEKVTFSVQLASIMCYNLFIATTGKLCFSLGIIILLKFLKDES